MASWCLFLVVNVLVCSVWAGLARGSPSSDVTVLQELLRKWKATARPDHFFENWRLNEDEDPCNERWNGVVCSPEKSVIHLHVNGAHLSGGIPPAIGALEELIILDLSRQVIYFIRWAGMLKISCTCGSIPSLSATVDLYCKLMEVVVQFSDVLNGYLCVLYLPGDLGRRTPLPIFSTYIDCRGVRCTGLP